jgi:hypothetical protein
MRGKRYSFAEITVEVVGEYNLQIAYPGQLPSHVSCLSSFLAFLIGARPSVHPLGPACLPAVVAV